jgi:hypothetical protein
MLTLLEGTFSYAIVHELDALTGRELVGIKCLICERTSWNDGDVQNLYCANCQIFHADNVPSIIDGRRWPIREPFIYKKPGLLERLWRVTDPLFQRIVRWCMKSKG